MACAFLIHMEIVIRRWNALRKKRVVDVSQKYFLIPNEIPYLSLE